MDLSTPAFDSVHLIDKALENLRTEVKDLEAQYGFSKDFKLPSESSNSILKDIPLNSRRFKEFSETDDPLHQIPNQSKQKPTPSLSSKWTSTFNKTNKSIPSLPQLIPSPSLNPSDFEFTHNSAPENNPNFIPNFTPNDFLIENWLESSFKQE